MILGLPKSAGITSSDLLAFSILWIIQFPFAFVHPSKINMVFRVKSVVAPIGLFATLIWALVSLLLESQSYCDTDILIVQVSSGGADFDGLSNVQAASGATLAWSFMKAINTIVSNVIPPLVNISDLSRYAERPKQTLPMPVGLLISKPLVTLLGMIITAAGYKQFGEVRRPMQDAENKSFADKPAHSGLLEPLGLLLEHLGQVLGAGRSSFGFLRRHYPGFRNVCHQLEQQLNPRWLRLGWLVPKIFYHRSRADSVLCPGLGLRYVLFRFVEQDFDCCLEC
jgi:cytosine/uracil/thiamine/allantoin permease